VERVLRVLVTSVAIEDGAVPPPAVGEVAGYLLTFQEAPPEDPTASVLRARAEPLTGDRLDGVPLGPPPHWPTLLTGDGWTALWSAPRAVVGEVELCGTLLADLGPGNAAWPTRGRVTRVRVVSVTRDPAERHIWRPLPGGWQLRDAEIAPRWFDSSTAPPPDARGTGWYAAVPADPWVPEIGALVDLDLDDVPPLPLRPALVPGAVAGHGADLWVADERLPLLVRLRGSELVDVHRWPGGILPADLDGGRVLHADADGCWITGPDGVHRCDRAGPVRRVDDAPAWLSAAHRGTLAAVAVLDPGDPRGRTVLRLHTRDGAVTEVPAVADRVAALVTTSAGFLLGLRGEGLRLAHLGPTGELREGPPLTAVRHLLGLIGGPHPALVSPAAAPRPVLPDLSVGGRESGRVLRGWAVGGRTWVCTHPPDGWDPAAAGIDPSDARQRWLLAEVDSATRAPLRAVAVAVAVTGIPEQLTVVDGRAVWVASGAVHRWPTDGAVPEELDVAAALGC